MNEEEIIYYNMCRICVYLYLSVIFFRCVCVCVENDIYVLFLTKHISCLTSHEKSGFSDSHTVSNFCLFVSCSIFEERERERKV